MTADGRNLRRPGSDQPIGSPYQVSETPVAGP